MNSNFTDQFLLRLRELGVICEIRVHLWLHDKLTFVGQRNDHACS